MYYQRIVAIKMNKNSKKCTKQLLKKTCGTSKTAKIGCFDRFSCIVSLSSVSRILLRCSGATMHENLSEHQVLLF